MQLQIIEIENLPSKLNRIKELINQSNTPANRAELMTFGVKRYSRKEIEEYLKENSNTAK